jgi:Xaa-Pro aminopeptidase
LLEGRRRLVYTQGHDEKFDAHVTAWCGNLPEPPDVAMLHTVLAEMRLTKSASELRCMRQAAAITVAAHQAAARRLLSARNEAELHAELIANFIARHAEASYPPIVAAGNNAVTLHYHRNNAPLNAGELLLIDAGAEVAGYAADVTRVYPISGRFSEPQAALYDLVLQAQAAAIQAAKPGARWIDPHNAAVRCISQGLIDLGLLHGQLDAVLESAAYTRFFPHKTGHWLGLDVHDVGEYRNEHDWRTLQEGMVLTIEPGIYIRSDNKTVPALYRGIGIRIEDDVCITKDGNEVLTQAMPKQRADIEALVLGTN